LALLFPCNLHCAFAVSEVYFDNLEHGIKNYQKTVQAVARLKLI
jgi:hypothetical protein